jgi:hypothetical protein
LMLGNFREQIESKQSEKFLRKMKSFKFRCSGDF